VHAATRIASRQHPVIRRCRVLATRPDAGEVLLDGEHLVTEALTAGVPLTTLLTDGRHSALASRGTRAGTTVYEAPDSIVAAASPVRTSSGVVAVARWQPVPVETVLTPTPALVVGLIDVQDPGNVGSVIRSADALGATGVVAVGATADPGAWKTLRGSMGAVFRLPVARSDFASLAAGGRKRGCRLVATAAHEGLPPDAVDWTSPVLLLVGREGTGLPQEALAEADDRVSIPMQAGVDSLNVAVATALLLYDARRFRAIARS
jgi:TrmH family RNA methyltransferase